MTNTHTDTIKRDVAEAHRKLAEFIDNLTKHHLAEIRRRLIPFTVRVGHEVGRFNLRYRPVGWPQEGGTVTCMDLKIGGQDLYFKLPPGLYEFQIRAPFFHWKEFTIDNTKTGFVDATLTPHF